MRVDPMNTGISICVPWRSDEPSRVAAWTACAAEWGRTDFELSVADDGLTGLFSRARAINRAVAGATGDVVVIHGADQLPDVPAIIVAGALARKHGWSMIYSKAVSYDQAESEEFYETGHLPVKTPRSYLCPGLVAVTRTWWDKVGGMDERFGTGYGYEDAALRNLLAARAGTHALNERYPAGVLRCLFHRSAGTPDAANAELFWREYANLAPTLN